MASRTTQHASDFPNPGPDHVREHEGIGNPSDNDGDFDENVLDWKQLHQLTTALLSPAPMTARLHMILQAVLAFHASTQGTISIYDRATQKLTVIATAGLSASTVAFLSAMPQDGSSRGIAFTQGRRTIITDVAADPRSSAYLAQARIDNVRAAYATPCFDAGGATPGVLSIYYSQPHQPTEREMRLAEICASNIGQVIAQEHAASALQYERARRDDVLGGMAEGLCILDHDFRLLEVNAAAERICQMPGAEMLGRTHWELWPEAANSALGAMLRASMQERTRGQIENRWVDPTGQVGWYDIYTQPIAAGLAIYFRDISQRKKNEAMLARSEMRYRTLSETVSEVVWHVASDGAIVQELPSWARFSGQSWEEYSGAGWMTTVHPDDLARATELWNRSMATGATYHIAYRLRRHDGEYRHMLARGVPLTDQEGNITEWIGNCEDVTDSLRIQEQLHLADRRKDEFLAILSHELRSPLHATGAAAELLQHPQVTPERSRQMGQVIGRQVGHMSRLVEDLLDVSRVARGLIRLENQAIGLATVIRDAIEQVQPMMAAKKHTLAFLPADAPDVVWGDRIRLTQVLVNLLSNAARYTPEPGQIEVRLAAVGDGIRVEVADNGIGLDPANRANLFDLFVQAELSSGRSSGGLGLGLALVKSLVELHGGPVTAASDGPGLGSTFAVTLPRLPTA